MKVLKSILVPILLVGISTPVNAGACDMWGTARTRPMERQFNLKELAEFVKNDEFATMRNCYGTESLKTNITMAPFEMDPYSGEMTIVSQQNGNNGHHKVEINDKVFEMKTNGDNSQVLGSDNNWHDVIPALQGIQPIVESMEQGGMINPVAVEEMQEYSNEKLAPMADAVLLSGIGGVASSFGLLFSLQYAPLADSEGLSENVGGWDTTVWKVNNDKAKAYAASRGRAIDTSGSHIRYWVTNTGLVVKVDAFLTAQLLDDDLPMVFKYQVSK